VGTGYPKRSRDKNKRDPDKWVPLKTLLLRPDSNFLFLRSSNISIYYPVLETSKSLSAHQNRGFLVLPKWVLVIRKDRATKTSAIRTTHIQHFDIKAI
jgi:uncharacterized membrane protein YdbT with pleckstrin-like domain